MFIAELSSLPFLPVVSVAMEEAHWPVSLSLADVIELVPAPRTLLVPFPGTRESWSMIGIGEIHRRIYMCILVIDKCSFVNTRPLTHTHTLPTHSHTRPLTHSHTHTHTCYSQFVYKVSPSLGLILAIEV